MKKLFTLFAIVVLTFQITLRADEGMWLLNMLDKLDMNKLSELGLELSPEDIYSINNSSLKDAIGALDYGSCTSELISPDGLLLTNHHCAYSEIQNHSSLENDYLRNGFWAMTKEEELPNQRKSVSFVIRIEDVTDEVLPKIDNRFTGFLLRTQVESITKEMIEKAIEGTHYEASVVPFYNGNKYFLIVLETFLDVRLVGTPPESIGKFGADTDNWMWPRHTGDFTLLRVYTGPDGKPAEYSPLNIPMKSRHFLPVSLKGYKEDDFAMVLGFPGSTDRYMTSFEIEELLKVEHPNRIKVRGVRQELLKQDMQADDKIRIQYSSKYSSSSNYWKYSIGQSQGLIRLNVAERKRDMEARFTDWVNSEANRSEKYGNTLEMIKDGVNGREDYVYASQFLMETMFIGMESLSFSFKFRDLYMELTKTPSDNEKIKEFTEKLKEDIIVHFKDYNAPTDKTVSEAMLELIAENIKPDLQPDIFELINKRFKGDPSRYTSWYFKKSIFPYREKLESFLEKPSAKVLEKDPAFRASLSVFNTYIIYYGAQRDYNAKVEEGRRLWMEGLMEMMPEKVFYPDANSTIRLSYGTVGGYWLDSLVYNPYKTTLSGAIAKEDPDNWEFFVPDKLKDLYNNKDYGIYAEDGVLPVCFITNNDITGGNSGSPVLNGKGELIGLAFDGNWEAMSGDIEYEHNLQRCINVDIRYVLFIIDKYAGAKHLIDEMRLVN